MNMLTVCDLYKVIDILINCTIILKCVHEKSLQIDWWNMCNFLMYIIM